MNLGRLGEKQECYLYASQANFVSEESTAKFCRFQGAEYVGLGLVAASVKVSEWMYRGTDALKDQIEPDSKSTPVDPRLKNGLEVAQWTASKAAQGSGYLGRFSLSQYPSYVVRG